MQPDRIEGASQQRCWRRLAAASCRSAVDTLACHLERCARARRSSLAASSREVGRERNADIPLRKVLVLGFAPRDIRTVHSGHRKSPPQESWLHFFISTAWRRLLSPSSLVNAAHPLHEQWRNAWAAPVSAGSLWRGKH